MKIVVADSSSCILLQKCALLTILAHEAELFIEQRVYEECASTRLSAKYPDAKAIRDLVEGGRIRVKRCKRLLPMPILLDEGERASISLFREIKADLLLTDDGSSIKACRFLSIPFLCSLQVVVELHASRKITTDDALRAIKKLRVVGRYSENLITAALVKLRSEGGVEE